MPTPRHTENRADARTSTREQIVAAAARLLRDSGVTAVTTRAVAQEAGVPPPRIFRLFGDKDGLLEAVAEQVLADHVTDKATRAAAEEGDPVDDLRAAWRTNLEFGLANPDLFALLAAPGRLQHSPAMAAGTAVLEARVTRVAAAGLLRVSEARAVDMIHAAGTGAVLTLLARPAQERDPGIADSLLEAVLNRILVSAPATPRSDAALR